jgi:glycosyltransferase involved in cell wall biosynthesis
LIAGLTVYPSKKTRDFFERFKDNISYIKHLRRNISIFYDIRAFFSLYRLFKKEKFDIVHTHTAKAGFIGRIAARLAGVRAVVHTPHGHNFYGYFSPFITILVIWLEKIASLFTDKIIVLTNIEKRDMLKYNIGNPGQIEIVHSGLDLDRYNTKINVIEKKAEFAVGQDEFLVGMVGRLETVKGPEYFIEAARYIAEKIPKTKFLVVGEGSLKDIMIKRSIQLNIDDKIIFVGWHEDIPEILSILDVLVLPSLNEAVGRVLLEAGASGKPVVATDVGGIPDIIKNNETGILVPPADSRKIAEAVISLLKDKQKRFEMGHAAKNWVNTKFSVDNMVGEVHNLYKSLSSNVIASGAKQSQ